MSNVIPTEESKIHILQREFLEKLKGMTTQEAKFVLKGVKSHIKRNSTVQEAL